MNSTSHTAARQTYEHIFSKGILVVAVFVTGLLLNSTVAAQTLNFFPGPTDYRIASIDNLTIDGTAYDITFTHGVSYNYLKTLGDPLTFTDYPSASGALSDVALFINAQKVDATDPMFTEGTLRMYIPYDSTTLTTSVADSNKIGFNPITYDAPIDSVLNPDDPLRYDLAWLTFSPTAIPEPTTSALSILGLMSLGFVRWRRRRR